MNTLWQDLRYGVRMLLRKPGFTLVAIITVSLGIGANTAIFSVVNAVMLRPLPFQEPDRLAMLWTDDLKRSLHEQATSYLTFTDWRTQSQTFADMAIFSSNPLVLTGGDEPERVKGEFVSANLFPLLGVEPVLGQTFSPDEEKRGEHVVVLSYGLWQRRFGGASDVLGKKLEIDGDQNSWKDGPRAPRIIGVMPAGFYFPDKETQLWEPATVYWRWKRELQSDGRFRNRRWGVVGRLKPNATNSEAQAEMSDIGQRLAEAYTTTQADFPGFAVSVVPMLDQVTGKRLQQGLWVLLGAVGFVLLIACSNVANLLLARGAARQREFAIRASLGANRARLLRQLLTESAVLACGAGLLGLLLSAWGIDALVALAPPGIPRLDEISIDDGVLMFTAGVSLLSGFLFGAGPAWKLSRIDPNEALKEGGSGASGGLRLRQTRGLLVMVECALAVALLTGAGLLIRSFHRLQSVDPGFKPDGLLLVRFTLGPGIKPPTQPGPYDTGQAITALKADLFFQISERTATLPGVRAVGAIGDLLIPGAADESITIEGRPSTPEGREPVQLASSDVSPEFFQAMGVPLLGGRFFSRADTFEKIRLLFSPGCCDPSSPGEAAIINETFARRFFPAEDPIGKRFYFGTVGVTKTWTYKIVGVVGDMHRQGLEKQSVPEYFAPLVGGTWDLVVQADSDPLALAGMVKETIRSVEKNLIILNVTTVNRRMGELGAERQFQTWLLALFAAVALALSAIGIYGVMHYAVAQRIHEIGIRIALGAQPADVLRLVIGQGMKLALIGVTIGLIAAWWLTDVMAHLLFEVSAHDLATFGGVALLLAVVALLACYLPARRATRVDPMVALRYE
jgi:putative ABC transport system permease protein